jgi:cytochrome c-type biogenesis protein CcmH/NrfG
MVECVRQMDLGRQAFAAGEYLRAAERFDKAVTAMPTETIAHLLLSQARFASRKYREAVNAVSAGHGEGRGAWPVFRPRDLYRHHPGDFPTQLDALRMALERHPNDISLQFLYAFQLWSDGRREEARPRLADLRSKLADPTIIDRILGQAQAPEVRK